MQVSLPVLGEGIESGDVLGIFVSVGDVISVDQDILELETDKATMPVPSSVAGKVTKILVSEGDTVTVGTPIIELEPSEAAAPTAAPTPPAPTPAPAAVTPTPAIQEPQSAAPAPVTPAPVVVAPAVTASVPTPVPAVTMPATPINTPPTSANVNLPGDGNANAAAGPSVRRLARELGVDLRRVRPISGDRITAEDLHNHVRAANQQADASAPASVTPPGTPESDGQGAVRVEKMSRMRKTIANNMLASYANIPQLTNFDDVDVTELEEMRQQSKADYAARGIKLTQLPFLIKAIASSLRLHPILNASVDMENNLIIYKEYVNIGIAVDTERGLVVPVLRDADRLSISQIAQKLGEIAEMARNSTFGIEDLRGGTFTISNLGAIGGTYSTPIINPPEVGILLAGRSRMLPQWSEGEFKARLVMPLSITYDHRCVDGAAAARFLNDVKGFLANPGRLLLAL